ncbi:MAG: hypothetical protein V1770_06535 [bacterium]
MIQNNDFDKKLLDTIKEKKMFPKPRWRFMLKNYFIWIAGGLSLILGATSVSLIIYVGRFDDWSIYQKIGKGIPKFILLGIPFFWLLCLALFVYLVYLNFKKTKTGYRYSIFAILMGAISLSVLFGFVFYYTGLSRRIDDIFGRKAPFYDRINPHIRLWSKPEEGRLSGLVLSKDDDFVMVVDRLGKEWEVSSKDFYNREEIQIGESVRFVGEKISNNKFRAAEILPVRSGRGYYERFKPKFPQDRRDRFILPRPLP